MRIAVAATLLVACTLFAASPARAAESYDNCAGVITSLPATINTQGVWCLQGDLTTAMATGTAITVTANNVTIDCNEFKLGGLAAGPDSQTVGILAFNRMNLAVRRCNVRGFYVGIYAEGGSGHLVEDNRLDGNNYMGIQVDAFASVIRRNLVYDSGGRPSGSSVSVGILASSGVDVLDNTVNGVTPGGQDGMVVGIYSSNNVGATVSGNRVTGILPAQTFPGWAIYDSSNRALIEGNYITGADIPLTTAIRCSQNSASALRNSVAGFAAAVSFCYSSDNLVNPN